jgi:hypothetical protein
MSQDEMNITRIDGRLTGIDTDMKELRLETPNGSASTVKYLNTIKPEDIERHVGEDVALILYDGQVSKVK